MLIRRYCGRADSLWAVGEHVCTIYTSESVLVLWVDTIPTTLTTIRPTSRTPTHRRWGIILKWDGGSNGENDKRVMLKMGGKEEGRDRVSFDIQVLILSSHEQHS